MFIRRIDNGKIDIVFRLMTIIDNSWNTDLKWQIYSVLILYSHGHNTVGSIAK